MREKLEQNRQEEQMGLFGRTLIIGLAGGLIWGTVGVILYFFNFSEVAPKSFLLRPWIQTAWTDAWQGHVLSILLTGVISLIPAVIYYSIFKKINSMWLGAGYGIVIWAIVFFFLQPLLALTIPVTELSMDTIVTTICIFLLYGTFVGYSISYNYHDLEVKAVKEKT